MKFTSVKTKLLFSIICSLLLLLASCSRTEEDNGNYTIKNVMIRFDDRTEQYKYDNYKSSIYFNLYLEMESGDDISKIDELKVFSSDELPTGGVTWTIPNEKLMKAWDEERKRFVIYSFYIRDYEKSLPLGEYTFELIKDDEVKSSFKRTLYARADKGQNDGQIYSNFTSKKPRVLYELENLKYEQEEESVKISFNTNDRLLTDGIVWVYDEEGNYLGGITLESIIPKGENVYIVDVSSIKNPYKLCIALFHFSEKEKYKNISYCVTSDWFYLEPTFKRNSNNILFRSNSLFDGPSYKGDK